MNRPGLDHAFAGSIPQRYDQYLVPLIFEPYAKDMARRVSLVEPSRLLEIAAGTGVVTREMARTLPSSVSIIASDLNQAMLDHAGRVGTVRPVEWRQADAMRLPFPDQSFDAVVCQFGAMFFPDKGKAFSETPRVLRPGGAFIFNVWDRIGENDFADIVTEALEALFPLDPPRFLARTPHGYHDPSVIAQDLANGGFDGEPQFATLEARSRADSPRTPAVAYCHGTPLRNEIEAYGAARLDEATDIATAAIAARFGWGAVDGKIQARSVTVER